MMSVLSKNPLNTHLDVNGRLNQTNRTSTTLEDTYNLATIQTGGDENAEETSPSNYDCAP